MKKDENAPLQVVYIVTCYQSIVGVYASQDDAFQCQRELIMKNRPADVLCRNVFADTKI
jgi:hypothetical protein